MEDDDEFEDVEIPPISPEGKVHPPVDGMWCAGLTQKGYYPDNPNHINQDAMHVHLDQACHLMSAFDGHGPHGHEVAQFVSNALPAMVDQCNSMFTDPAEAFKRAFEDVHLALSNCKAIDSRFSGTTAVSVMARGRTLLVANAGDSRAVLGRRKPQGGVEAVDLSEDHTPFRKDEKTRVEGLGARVLTSGEVHGEATYKSDAEYTADDPPRCYLQDFPFPGTAFTRSLGDQVAKRIGVVATPEVVMHTVGDQDRFLILASDGVWEFLTSEDAVRIVEGCEDPHQAASRLIEVAWEAWHTEDVRSDDITAVVVFLDAEAMP